MTEPYSRYAAGPRRSVLLGVVFVVALAAGWAFLQGVSWLRFKHIIPRAQAAPVFRFIGCWRWQEVPSYFPPSEGADSSGGMR